MSATNTPKPKTQHKTKTGKCLECEMRGEKRVKRPKRPNALICRTPGGSMRYPLSSSLGSRGCWDNAVRALLRYLKSDMRIALRLPCNSKILEAKGVQGPHLVAFSLERQEDVE